MPTGENTRTPLPKAPYTVEGSLGFIKQLNISAIHLGLDRIKSVLPLLGNPQNQRPCIHVAGTNGKGSTCALLESIYRHNGYRTGLTVSPHLISPQERIQINRQPLSDDAWMASFMRVYEAVSALPDGYLSYFEWLMLMAFDAFNHAQVDIAIIETGLGGRLDATNVIDQPLATVLTRISLDHQERLGHTLTAIAGEKADIIKPHTPVITAFQEPEAAGVIEQVQQQRQAHLIQASPQWRVSPEPLTLDSKTTMTRRYRKADGELSLSLLGQYQETNLAMALTTVETLETQFPTQWNQTKTALANTHWPGRYQWMNNPYGGWLVIDGSHNEEGLQQLAHSINHDCAAFMAEPGGLLPIGVSLMQHRNPVHLAQFIQALTVPVDIHCLVLESTQLPAMHAPHDLAALLLSSGLTSIQVTPLAEFLRLDSELRLITGSLYSAGHVLSQLSQIAAHHPQAGLAPSS